MKLSLIATARGIALPGTVCLLACGGHVATSPAATDDVDDGGFPDAGGPLALAEAGAVAPTSPGVAPGLALDAALDDAGAVFVGNTLDAGCNGAEVTQPPPVPLAPSASCSATDVGLGTWKLGGSAPSRYQTGLDTSMTCNGTSALHLSSSTATPQQFGEMGWSTAPGVWSGQRLRMTGWILASAVTGWAGLWMRVDTATVMGVSFDNMDCRPVTGTTGWLQVQVVLDVPSDATRVAYGLLLDGSGEVWLDGVQLETVDTCVPTTGCP
jgi:hypothetical protein